MKVTFTREEFVKWLKTKPPEEKYIFASNTNCAIAQFLKTKTKTKKYIHVGAWGYFIGKEAFFQVLPEFLLNHKNGNISNSSNNPFQTFGGLLNLLQ